MRLNSSRCEDERQRLNKRVKPYQVDNKRFTMLVAFLKQGHKWSKRRNPFIQKYLYACESRFSVDIGNIRMLP